MHIAFLTVEFVTETNRLAGAANFLARTVLAVRRLGHEPEVFTWSKKSGKTDYQGVPVHQIPWTRGWFHRVINQVTLRQFDHPLLICQMAYRMRQVLRQRHKAFLFDVVHVSGSGCTAFASTTLGIPTVVRFSGYQPTWSQMEGVTNLSARTVWQMELYAGRRAERCYAPSHLVAELFRSKHRLDVDVLEPSFILDTNKELFCYDIARTLPDAYILYFGPLNYRKGIDILANALRHVFTQHPQISAVFVGPDQGLAQGSAKEYVMKIVGDEYVERCRFLAPLPHEQLYPIVQGASCVVIPSRVDNIPNTCLEAMALGTVVVGTQDSSLEQMIDDGQSGFLVPQENPAILAQAILHTTNLPEYERTNIGNAAKARIDGLRPGIAGERLIQYFQQVILNKNSGNRKL